MQIKHALLFSLGSFATSVGSFSGKVLGDISDLHMGIAKDVIFHNISIHRRTIDDSERHTLFRVETRNGDIGYNTEFHRLFHPGNKNMVFSYERIE